MSINNCSMSEKRVAMLVIDMQEAFRPIAAKIVPEINETLKKCRSKRVPVIFTQHGHRYPKLDCGSLADKWGIDDMIVYGSEKWQFLNELEVGANDVQVVEKRRYNAFYGTLLDNMLRQMQVDTVVVSGVMTNLCCESTARAAFDRDFKVIFLRDGTNTKSKEMHEATFRPNIEQGLQQRPGMKMKKVKAPNAKPITGNEENSSKDVQKLFGPCGAIESSRIRSIKLGIFSWAACSYKRPSAWSEGGLLKVQRLVGGRFISLLLSKLLKSS
uniref:Isochorismatase-like domain-containing protein n=1 Tax=Romanomermis culicivorax TaxID=13658 RepID=A0A915JRK9_ROMCU